MTSEPDKQYDSIAAIIDDFRPFDNVYKRAAIDAAIARREEITPHLLQLLDETLADPEGHFGQSGHTYATMLLAHFREPQAHERFIALFSLPEDQVDWLYRDMITEDLPALLLRTCDGSADGIKGMILDPSVYEYCRFSALTALTYAVIEGCITRQEALDFLNGLFTGNEADKNDYYFWEQVISTLCRLHPAESMSVIEDAFERELALGEFIDMADVQRSLAKSQDQALDELRQRMTWRSLDDMHQAMAWWAMFHEHETTASKPLPTRPASPVLFSPPAAKSSNARPANEKTAKKKRRKTAKASRKKQRRKKK